MPENEYDDLIAEGEVKELPVLNEYDRAIDQMADDNRTRVKTAAFSGSVVNPDERARSMDLASKNNLPVDVVERNPEHVRRMDVLRRNDYDDIIDRSPKFAEWLSDPNHAALSQDDIESLRGISELVSGKDYYGPPRSQHDYIAIAREDAIRKGSLTDYIRTLPIIRNVAGLVGGVGQGVKDIAGAAAFVAEIAGADGALEAQKSLASESADIGRDIAGMGSSSLERGLQRVGSGVARVATGVVAAGTAVRGLQFIGMAPRMAGYLGQGTFAAALGAEQANLQANESEVSGGAKAAYIMEHAATEAGFTLLFGLRGAEAFGQPLTPIITDTFKRYLHYAGEAAGEIIEENATNLAHDFIDFMQLPENANQTVGEAFNNWLASVPETTAISGIVGGFAPSMRHSRAEIQDAKRAEATFLALGTGVKDSKTFKRLPESVKKLIEGQTKNGPMANLYLPIDTWNTYWQSQGADPREVAAHVTGDPNAYDQAVLAGHDLTVPTARYATTIAPSDHNGFFVKELRTSPAAMNSREADTLSKKLEKAQPESAKESAANVASAIEEQLINAGYDPSAAKTNASLHEAFYGTMAAKAGIDPQALFDRYNQQTTRAVPESIRARQAVEPIDAMLDRLRSNDIPNDNEIFGTTLIEFLRPSGLKDSQGDLASLEPNASTKAFQRHLMREDGIDLDEASQRAHRAGYIKEPDINLLLDAIGEELAGRPTYMEGQEHPTKLAIRQGLDELSSYLRELGVDVQKQSNAEIKKIMEGHGLNEEVSAEAAQELAQTQDQGDKAKKIGGYNRLTHRITIYHGANRSTFLHESGHFFLEVFGDLAQEANAPQQLKDDYQKALDWLGVKSRDEIGRDQHEQWARGFEHYLAEGKAPSNALRRAFASFRQWLVGIYKNLLNLNVTLTDEVRGVMDRLLAVDNEILAAEERLGFAPVFTTAKDAGWTDAEFATYRSAVTSAQINATEKLTMQVMEQMDREKRAWWDRELKAAREEVTRDIDQRPLARALALLQRGTLPDGSPLPEGVKAAKLDKKAIVEEFGHDFLKKLPRPYIYTTKDGVSPQTMAEQFGFKTASYFLHALANAPRRKDQIKTEADALMLQKYPDMRLDGSMPEAAVKAVHNEKRSDLLELEVAKLSEKSKGRAAPADFLRSKARSVIAGMTGRNVQPLVYQRAEAKANHAAFKAASKGDFATALQEKQRELYNHELYRAAVDARADMEKIAAYMRGFRKEAVRSRLGKAGADYLEQIDAINARFEFAMVPGWKAGVQRSFTEWVTAKQASGESFGEEIGAPPELTNEGFKANYKDLTIETLRGIRDTVKQIATMARESNRMLAMDKAAKWSQVKSDLIASLKENYAGRGKPPFTPDGLSGFDKLKAGAAKFDASLIKMEQLIEWLDGGKIDGPWHKALWNGASDAQNAENDYTKTVTAPIAQAINNVPKSIRKHMLDKIDIPGIERAMVRKNIIAVALNVGNASNKAKLLKGMQWNEAQLQSMLKVLTKEEWDVVQGIWDTLESIYPNIAALQKELTGLEPEKVVATPVVTEHGTYRGGYYPVMYDQSSNVGEMQLAGDIGGLVEKHFTRATTPKGHTKKRAEAFAKPFDLSLERLPNHIAGVVKDLTHRKWLIDANKIVSDEEIRAVLVERMGEPYAKLFPAWVRQVVNDRNVASAPSLASWRGLMEHARYNLTIMGIGFKVGTMTSQLAGIAPAIETVGGNELDGHQYMTAALGKFLASPKASYQFITAKSGEMRHRFENRELSIRDKIRTLQGNDSLLSKIQQTAFLGVGYSEMMISAPTWLAGYQKALDQGHSDADAVRSGDRAVRLSQGAAGAKDLSAVVADRETMRLFTLFYTPWSALYSRLRSIGHDAGNVRNLPRTIIRAGWTTIVAATLGEILSGHGPKEDEPWWQWWIRVNAIYPFMGIPVVRDIAAATVSDYGYQFSPLAQAGKAVAAVGKDTIDVFQGDAELDKLAIDSLNAAGYALGLPVGQLKITGDYLLDLASGDDSPEDIGQFMHDLFYRRDKK